MKDPASETLTVVIERDLPQPREKVKAGWRQFVASLDKLLARE